MRGADQKSTKSHYWYGLFCCKSQKSSSFITLFESLHQHQQGTKATLVPFALKLKAAITQRFVLCAACHPAGCWVPPLPSLSPHTALSVLKKRGKTLLSRVDIRFQFLLNLCRMHAIQLPKAHVRWTLLHSSFHPSHLQFTQFEFIHNGQKYDILYQRNYGDCSLIFFCNRSIIKPFWHV